MIAQSGNLWNALFTRTQRQVLSLMFGFPRRSFYANEVVRRAGVGTGSVQRELARLSACGLLDVTRQGNQKHYQANPDCPIFPELRSIVLKTFGALDQLRTALADLQAEIHLAYVFGPGAQAGGQAPPDIDLLIVSDSLDYSQVVGDLTAVENRIGRTVHPVLLKRSEFEKLTEDDPGVVAEVLHPPRVMLTGNPEDIPG